MTATAGLVLDTGIDERKTGPEHSQARQVMHPASQSTDPGKKARKAGFFVSPMIRRYIENGILYRVRIESKVSRFELFLDLILVGVVHQLNEWCIISEVHSPFSHSAQPGLFGLITALSLLTAVGMTLFIVLVLYSQLQCF